MMAKEHSLNRKKVIKERILEHQERQRTQRIKIWVNTTDFPSLEFSKLYLTVEEKIIIPSDMVLNMVRR